MSPYAGPVYYMGNPEIIAISADTRYITITAETHGTDLTTSDAFTLVMVAKDGLAGYATGTKTGNMGTQVLTNGTATVNTISNVDDNKTVSFTFDLVGVGIDANASCIGIVDVDNGHSAVSLSNFPTSALAANFNNKNN
jgi:hypothetical protein